MPVAAAAKIHSSILAGMEQVPGLDLRAVTTIRDALYDRVPMAEPELALIGTPAFLRLERVQQLGFAARVWPGARHARFEHSIGVYHLTRLAIAHLRRREDVGWITETDARTIGAAALLHDIGHYPFSHAIEELGYPIVPHERVGRAIVEADPVSDILRGGWGVDPARVAAILDPEGRELPESDRILRGLLSGPLDMDKLDYLPRDARACHVPYGGVDSLRLIDALAVAEVEGARRVVVGDKGVSPLHSLINARQEMFDNVYWHHTNRACMAMLQRAVQDALLAGALSPDELTRHDDASLMAVLCQPGTPPTTRALIGALEDRRIHKRVVEVSARSVELYARLGNLYFDPAARRETEDALASRLADALGRPVAPGSVLLSIPKPERWRTDVWVRFDRPPVGFSRLMPWREVVGLQDDDFKRYEEHRRLIRILATAEHRDAVRARWEELLYPLLGGVF